MPSNRVEDRADRDARVLRLQRLAGNSAVAYAIRSSSLQRYTPTAVPPPKRPKPKYTAKKRTSEAPMSLGEVYVAIGRMEPDPIDERDLKDVDRSNLRILHGYIQGALAVCRTIQSEKIKDPDYVPPGRPDRDYEVVEGRLKELDDKVLAHEPYGTLNAVLAVQDLGSQAIGGSAEAKKLWSLSWEMTRDLLWHEDTGPAKVFNREVALSKFEPEEIIRYGYVTHDDARVWGVIAKEWARLVAEKTDPDDPSPKLPDSTVRQAIKVGASLVPVELASYLMSVRSTATVAEIKKKLASKLDSIDQTIYMSLNTIILDKVRGRLPWSNTDVAEDAFIDWATGQTEGVYGIYSGYVQANLEGSGIFPEVPLPE